MMLIREIRRRIRCAVIAWRRAWYLACELEEVTAVKAQRRKS